MSIPPSPPSNQPGEPDQPPLPSKNNRRTGAIAAAAAVVVIAVLIGIVSAVSNGRIDALVTTGFIIAPVVSLACVVVGSILTIFEPVRQFAVGFLIASAVLIVVTAGGCVAVLSSPLGSA